MQTSLSLARKAVFGATAVVAALMLGACDGGSSGEDNLIHVMVKVESITQEGKCDPVSVRSAPKNLLPNPPSVSNSKMFYTELEMAQASADDVACRGEKETIPMAPGVWEFKVQLPSGPVTCERDVQVAAAGQPGMTLTFKDGVEGCG